MYLLSLIVVRTLKQQLTTSFTAPIIIVQGKPSLKINQGSGTILRQRDSIVAKILLFDDNELDFENNENFTDVYNRVYFINRDIQLSLIRVKPNGSVVSFYSYTNETFMF